MSQLDAATVSDRPAPADDDRPRCKPRPEALEKLEFERQKMVAWFDPGQLVQTITRTVLASVFGTYADKRELQEALSHGREECFDYSEEPGAELWIDYVADVGEGFASTYTVAWLLAQERLPLPPAPGRPVPAAPAPEEGEALPRGRILVMGGDEVYPTPTQDDYANRMSGPYDAAFPCLPDRSRECPHLFAIPGNHDWYDGLTGFLRQFCQGRSIGAWKTRQVRSYWALKLPHGWWLWGTDIQLGADIDAPQLEYFRRKAREAAEGDRVVLCTAEPSWVHAATRAQAGDGTSGRSKSPFDNLQFFEREIIRKNGLVLAATLTGDAHHYTRYSHRGPQGESVNKLTAGGGGAHTTPTHHLPDRIPLTFSPVGGEGPVPVELERRVEFPSKDESRGLLAGLRRFRERNPGMASLLGGLYAVVGVLLFGAVVGWDRPGLSPISGVLLAVAVVAGVLVILCTRALANLSPGATPDALRRAAWMHGLWHLLAIVLPTVVVSVGAVHLHRELRDLPSWIDTLGFLLAGVLFALVMGWLGTRLGSRLMARYLRKAEAMGVNTSEAFAAQSLESYKNFLRLRLTADGLTVYPFGVRDAVPFDAWVPDPQGPPGSPLLRPPPGALKIELIEEPVFIPRGVQPPYRSAPRTSPTA